MVMQISSYHRSQESGTVKQCCCCTDCNVSQYFSSICVPSQGGSSSSEVLSYSLHTEYRVGWWRCAVHFGRLLLAANFLQFIDFIPSFLFLAVGYYHDLGPIKHKWYWYNILLKSTLSWCRLKYINNVVNIKEFPWHRHRQYNIKNYATDNRGWEGGMFYRKLISNLLSTALNAGKFRREHSFCISVGRERGTDTEGTTYFLAEQHLLVFNLRTLWTKWSIMNYVCV